MMHQCNRPIITRQAPRCLIVSSLLDELGFAMIRRVIHSTASVYLMASSRGEGAEAPPMYVACY